MAEGVAKRDVPDTLWIGGLHKDSSVPRDRSKFRASFTDWMKPYNFEIVDFSFWPGFAWGTVRMKSAKQRNILIEHAKTKKFQIDGETLIVKTFERVVQPESPARKDLPKSGSKTDRKSSAASSSSKSETPKLKKINVAENILQSKRNTSSSPLNWRERSYDRSSSRSQTASPSSASTMSNRQRKQMEYRLMKQYQQQGSGSAQYPDSHQLFVGNLPHSCTEMDLEELFGKFGKVVEARISSKGVDKSLDSNQTVPNFGFVVFEDERSVIESMKNKPIKLDNGHRINVEVKKNKLTDDSRLKDLKSKQPEKKDSSPYWPMSNLYACLDDQSDDDDEDEDAEKNGFNDDVWKSFKQTIYETSPGGFGFFGNARANTDPSAQKTVLVGGARLHSPIPHDDVSSDEVYNAGAKTSFLDDDYIISSDEFDGNSCVYHQSSNSDDDDSENEDMPRLVADIPLVAELPSSTKAPASTMLPSTSKVEITAEPNKETSTGAQAATNGDTDNAVSQFTGGVRCVKGLVISCRKNGSSPDRPLEVQTQQQGGSGKKRANIFMALSDIKNWKGKMETDPAKLVGDTVIVHLSGQGDGVFLFAELGAFWDKTSSEAIDKAISVLMNYFEWSLKDPKSSEVEFKKLVTEIHATVETRDISNLVRTKLATAAERFTAVPREKTSAGKVEIIDDDNDVIEDDFKDEDIEDEKNDITFGDNVLMPLVPGIDEEYEDVFVLPKDDDEDIEQTKKEKKKKDKKAKDKLPATNVSAATSPKKSGASSSSQARDSEEEAMKEDMKSWLTLFYFGNDCDKSESETKAQFVIVDLLFSNVSLKKLLSVFRVSVEEECNLVQFCSKISDLVENGDDRNGQLWSDVHPVLTYLLSKYFPANIVPASVKNALRAISFRSYKNENFYQVLGVIEYVGEDFGVICSSIGYVVFDLALLDEPDLVGQLVLFCAWRDRLLLLPFTFPTYVACSIVKFFGPDQIGAFHRDKLSKYYSEEQKKRLTRFLSEKNFEETNPLTVFERVMTEFNSKSLPSMDRLSIETFVLSRSVFETFTELEAFFVKKISPTEKDNSAQKAKLYVSIWARLGFTVSHLESDYRHLSILGIRDCVTNCWQSLLYLVRLPKNVNPVELIQLTISFFDGVVDRVTFTDFGSELEDMSIDRANVEELVSGLQGKFRLPKPIVLPPVVAAQRPKPEELALPPNVANFFQGFAQEPLQQQQFLPQQQQLHQQQQQQQQHLIGAASRLSLYDDVQTQGNFPHFANGLFQEVKVQGEHGEIYKFALDERGNLPFDIVNALCVGTVALKYRLNDQTWRIISKAGNVFPQPTEGWADRVYMSIGQQVPGGHMSQMAALHQLQMMGFPNMANPFLGQPRPF